jgi:predicted AAA+ superfamily ATPase
MAYLRRILEMKIPKRQSAFLWGARQTGKSTFLKQQFPDAYVVNLLDTDTLLQLTTRPSLLREWVSEKSIKTKIVVIDEVQKIPALLDEVHLLIEEQHIQFILCGSSARKLRRGHANLLGGRAWRFEMLPLCYPEIPEFDLLRALQYGLLPRHYLEEGAKLSLNAYVNDYLKEEIRDEALTRNLPAFSRFLEAAAFSAGEIVNYSSVARDVAVDSKTVKEFFQIAVDTLVGILIEPWSPRRGRATITVAPKFYFFDVGIANKLASRTINQLKGPEAGKAFENYILMELKAYISYQNLDYPIRYWRTKSGLEVDFILDVNRKPLAFEAKISNRIDKHDLKGFIALQDDVKIDRCLLICNEPRARTIEIEGRIIEILPWRRFLDDLWQGKIIPKH